MKKTLSKKNIFISLIFCTILVFFMLQQATSRYILSKNIDIPVIGSKYYVEFAAAESKFIENSHNTFITVKNNNGSNYMMADLEYTMSVESDKFDVVLSNEGVEQVLAGGDFRANSYPINLIKKPGATLGFKETTTITFNITHPYTDTQTITIDYVDYNTDGLILHYDGINNTGSGHSNSANIWHDLSGNGNDGTITNAIWSNNNMIKFDYTSRVETNLSLTDSTPYTVEITFNNLVDIEGQTGGNGMFFSTSDYSTSINGLVGAVRPDGMVEFMQRTDSKPDAMLERVKNKTTFTVVNSQNITNNLIKQFFNGVYQNQYSQNTVVHTHPIFFNGTTSTGYRTDAEIYSIRVYNRALTAEEVETNSFVDQVRFNF